METSGSGYLPFNVGETGICRLCMKTREYYLNLFVSNEDFSMTIGEAVEDLFHIRVAQGDSLPETVCYHCVRKLTEFRDFKDMCVHSVTELGRLVETITSPIKVEVKGGDVADEGGGINRNGLVGGECQGPARPNDASPEVLEVGSVEDTIVIKNEMEEKSRSCGGEEEFAAYAESSPCVDPLDVTQMVGNTEDTIVIKNETEEKNTSCGGEDKFAAYAESSPCVDPLDVTQMVELSRIKVEKGETELEQEFYPQVILETVEEGEDPLDNQTTATDNASLLPKTHQGGKLAAEEEEGGGGGAVGGGCLGPPLVVRALVRHFGCPCCGKSFVKSSHLTRHIRTHTNERPFACDLCGKRYIENSDLTSHKMSHSGRRPFSCPVCGKGFYRNSHLNRHANTHRGGRAVGQPSTMDSAAADVIQGLKREQGADANVHFMGRLLEGSNGCRPSNDRLQRLSWLRDERSLLHPNGGIGVKTELLGDVPAGDYSPECGLADDRRQGVNGRGDVDGGKHCVCSHCGKGFGESSQLLCHARTHHSGELPFACGDCGRRYVKASDLTQHAKSHSAVKPHRCVQCGKGFTKSSHLKRHCITHTDERPYSCAVCRKGFVESSDLNRHMAVHTGSDEGIGAVEYATQEGRREYVCRLCGKGFSFRSNLVAHVRTHSGSKPFVCEHCGRGFAQSGNLRTHLRVHTGERPFACGVCHKRFSQKSTLNHHAKTH